MKNDILDIFTDNQIALLAEIKSKRPKNLESIFFSSRDAMKAPAPLKPPIVARLRKVRSIFILGRHASSGFTLLELLIVIGVLGILATALILVLNPLEFFKQSRDARRITDLKAINSALGIATIEGLSLGTASTVYVSIPDASATCANLGLPALPTGYIYACSTETNYMKANGTGWIPVNLTALSTRSPLSRLPSDPVNTTSTGYYYTYIMGGSYALTSTLESDKLLKQTALNDGGYDPGRYEVGSDLKLVARQEGLVGWWTFDEGSGTTAGDGSGNGNNGTWQGTLGSQWVGGKVGSYAGNLNGSDNQILTGSFAQNFSNGVTIVAWANLSQVPVEAYELMPLPKVIAYAYVAGASNATLNLGTLNYEMPSCSVSI